MKHCLLKLNCDKALTYLYWNANLEFDKTIRFTNQRYFDRYSEGEMLSKTLAQTQEYEDIARWK